MASKHTIAATTYPAAALSGILARRGLVWDATNKGSVKLPAATPETTFAGVAMENISGANNVAVQYAGYAIMESDGSAVINPGDDIVLVGTTGRVKSKAIATGSTLTQVIGASASDQQIPATAGAWVTVWLSPYKAFTT